MKTRLGCSFLAVGLLSVYAIIGLAQAAGDENLPQGFQHLEFKVDGVTRETLVYVPPTAKTTSTPVVFVFHGQAMMR